MLLGRILLWMEVGVCDMEVEHMSEKFKIALIDYGMGNVRSIKNAILHIGDFQIDVTADPEVIRAADCLLLPGVGAYPDAIKNLKEKNLISLLNEQVLEKNKPVLGICLGMQLLFTSSAEGGYNEGLGWIPGIVEYMELDDSFRIPHVGWNELHLKRESTMFNTLGHDKDFYFVHSYYANCNDNYIIASFNYGKEFTAAVQYKNIVGMQFHPEKSQQNGMKVLRQFIEWARGFSNA